MPSKQPLVIFCLLLLSSVAVIYLITVVFTEILDYLHEEGKERIKNSWIFRLILNLLGYASIFVPGIVLYQYVTKSKFIEKSEHDWLHFLTKELFFGLDKGYTNLDGGSGQIKQRSLLQETFLLLFCSSGLLISYLTWGLIQEKIMTQKYTNSLGETGVFKDSQFLVFVNRVLAFILSGFWITVSNQPRHTVPFYKYIYCSFSNIMSSWCQYEALKFISFPTQVLAKACKIIPVMLMGIVVSRKKYDFYEYVIAVLICFGMVMFLFGSTDATRKDEVTTTFSGIILIAGYLVFDSFTSNWQSALFTRFSTTSVQMMCGVNFFSCLLTSVSLIQQGSFSKSSYFIIQFPTFAVDCLFLSICSALGQLFIFYTISVFGPVVFVIIMSVRQALAIILSCMLYHHIVEPIGIIGITTIFFAIFARTYCSQKVRASRKRTPASTV